MAEGKRCLGPTGTRFISFAGPKQRHSPAHGEGHKQFRSRAWAQRTEACGAFHGQVLGAVVLPRGKFMEGKSRLCCVCHVCCACSTQERPAENALAAAMKAAKHASAAAAGLWELEGDANSQIAQADG